MQARIINVSILMQDDVQGNLETAAEILASEICDRQWRDRGVFVFRAGHSHSLVAISDCASTMINSRVLESSAMLVAVMDARVDSIYLHLVLNRAQ